LAGLAAVRGIRFLTSSNLAERAKHFGRVENIDVHVDQPEAARVGQQFQAAEVRFTPRATTLGACAKDLDTCVNNDVPLVTRRLYPEVRERVP
jgi:hypothetical protein